uniref:U57-Sparatoxin-Hju1b_1 n=1 Tax=Heteropoda jugulans TaxID=1358901 RepID=A0A4Q8KBG4_9ARAC
MARSILYCAFRIAVVNSAACMYSESTIFTNCSCAPYVMVACLSYFYLSKPSRRQVTKSFRCVCTSSTYSTVYAST